MAVCQQAGFVLVLSFSVFTLVLWQSPLLFNSPSLLKTSLRSSSFLEHGNQHAWRSSQRFTSRLRLPEAAEPMRAKAPEAGGGTPCTEAILDKPIYVPAEFECKHPAAYATYGLADWLVSNPAEPACWNLSSVCAPFKCNETSCVLPGSLVNLRARWTPLPASKTKVMVFQYGKVASTSLVNGLKLHSGIEAAHVHTPQQARQWLAGQSTGLSFDQQGWALSDKWSLMPGDKCYIITMSRSHFSRDPSEYFENILDPNHPYGFYPRSGVPRFVDTPPGANDVPRWNRSVVEELAESNISALLDDYRSQHDSIVLPYYATWFSQVFLNATGIDVLSGQFDFEKKLSVVHGERCTAIVLRFEDAYMWQSILGEFFPGFTTEAGNRGFDKWYSKAYAAFKANLTYARADLELMCATETERHFYKSDPNFMCHALGHAEST